MAALTTVQPVVAGLLVVLVACASTARQREIEQAKKDVSQEIERICALPPAQRETELAKLQKEEGLVLYCGKANGEDR